jgi:hypothetical protein
MVEIRELRSADCVNRPADFTKFEVDVLAVAEARVAASVASNTDPINVSMDSTACETDFSPAS